MPLVGTGQTFSSEEYPMIGPGVRARPAYDGSSTQRVEAVPVVRYYGTPLFTRSTRGVLEGGARVDIAPGLALGAQVAYEQGRDPNESAFLRSHNVAGINPGASVGVHLELDRKLGIVPVDVLGRVRKHVDADRGVQADLRVTAGVYGSGRIAAGVFTQATWASEKSANTFYGITPQQAAVTGLRAFDAGSGLLYTSIGLIWSVDLSRDWVVVGNVEGRHLQGDAANSPLTERRWNYYAAAGIAYRFGGSRKLWDR
jgi:outer membrane scaffolding protein for murein synthesis (MipA/OmpV family)